MLLSSRDLHKTFPGAARPVLAGVDLDLNAGETLALTGESGSGKSTLLHILGALDSPDTGTVSLNGTALHSLSDAGRADVRRTGIGLIFQQFNLIPSLDVAANISFQARLGGCHDTDWTTQLAAQLGLKAHLSNYPEQLSGGQQQRVAIARALAHRPGLILADEPTGNLDESTGNEVMTLLLDLVASSGAALLMVTHSERLARQLDRRVHLRSGRLDTQSAVAS